MEISPPQMASPAVAAKCEFPDLFSLTGSGLMGFCSNNVDRQSRG